MRMYKMIAAVGTVMMGISSFVTCLSDSAFISNIGKVFLLLSIVIMTYAFFHWQP